MSGGSATICGRPSTIVVSLEKACMLSRVIALARASSTSLRRSGASPALMSFMIRSTSMRAYQTARLVCPAKSRIASR